MLLSKRRSGQKNVGFFKPIQDENKRKQSFKKNKGNTKEKLVNQ